MVKKKDKSSGSNTMKDRKPAKESYLRKCCSLSSLFRFLSIITFQYIHSDLSSSSCIKCLQIVYTIIFTGLLGLTVNISPLAVFLYDWIACPMEYYDMCFIFEFHSDDTNNHEMPQLVMRGNEGDYINYTVTRQAIQPFDDLAKFTFLFILVSGALSYVLFCFPLIHHYIYHKIKKIEPDDPKLFHPFDDTDFPASTKLDKNKDNNEDKNERIYFYGFLTANLLFLLATWILFFCLQYTKEVRPPSKDKNDKISYPWFEGITVFIFFYSHWCTVISCFIFAKIMYGIQNKIKAAGSTDDLKILIEQDDDEFIKRAKKTLDYFQFWFFIHWVFYIVTSFLMIALSIEAILLHIRATQAHNQPGVHFSDGQMCLLVLLSISNVFMFIYPCIRAAGITRARKKYILDIVKNNSKTKKGYDDEVKLYVEHLQSRKFGFRLSIVCMRIPFDLNVAYTSILIGAFGIVLSILTSIAT